MSELILENVHELPDKWIHAPINHLVKQEKNSLKRGPFGSTIKKEFFVTSGYKVYEQQNVICNDFTLGRYYINKEKFQELKDFEVKPNDVLISCAGTIGKVAVVPENIERGIINQALLKITLEPSIIDLNYFTYLFSSSQIQKKILNDARGSAMQNFASMKELKQILFPIPPLNEQKRIVAKIEELFSLTELVKQTLQKTKILLKRYRQSLLKSAFAGKLVPQDPNDESASILLQKIGLKKHGSDLHVNELTARIGELPKNWAQIRVDEIFDFNYGKSLSEERRDNGEFPVYGSSGIIGHHSESLTKERCLIIGRKGSAGEVHRSTTKCWAIDTTYFIYVPYELDFDFIYYLFKYKKKDFVDNSTAVPSLVRDEAYSVTLTIPPLNEQKRIVAKIEESFSLIEKTENLIDSLFLQNNLMRNSILSQAFKGKLVPQDLSDESAEILLQKIKLEKQKIISQTTKPRKKNDK